MSQKSQKQQLLPPYSQENGEPDSLEWHGNNDEMSPNEIVQTKSYQDQSQQTDASQQATQQQQATQTSQEPATQHSQTANGPSQSQHAHTDDPVIEDELQITEVTVTVTVKSQQ